VTLFVAGKIGGCFGLKGYVKLYPSSGEPERMASLSDVFIGASDDAALPYVVEDVIVRPNGVVAKFAGVDDRTAAEKFTNCLLYVEEAKAKKPPKGAFFAHDIVGCEIWDTDGRLVGAVEDILKFPAQDLWSVRTATGTFLLPAVKEFVRKVDLKNRKIVVQMIEGLAQE
jgi:16S rRNA processing protein RimM